MSLPGRTQRALTDFVDGFHCPDINLIRRWLGVLLHALARGGGNWPATVWASAGLQRRRRTHRRYRTYHSKPSTGYSATQHRWVGGPK